MFKFIKLFLLIGLTSAWVVFLSRGFGSVPGLGELLSVSRDGLWRHKVFTLESRTLPGLKKPVTVTFDESGVPHFFADNVADLVRTQGYVMASQRLFQMDLSTRMTAGRLSEWFGKRTAEIDQFFVRFGMRQSAEKALKRFEQEPEIKTMLGAFVEGVNAFISSKTNLAPEYQILGVRPEPWDTMRVMHMAKQLTYSLAGRSAAIELTKIRQEVGLEKVLEMFPDHSPFEEIVYSSNSTGSPRRRESVKDHEFETHLRNVPPFIMPVPGNGSNNWAVSAKRSETGFSIMANDTHLGHSLPNVWYEAQLSVPEFNVYGVGLVGVPGLINGLNRDLSWGPTNGTTNVLDYLEIEFENETSLNYKVNGTFEAPDVKKEKVGIRKGDIVEVEVLHTRFGPLVHREGRYGLVARWTGHETDNELFALRQLYSSRSIDECLRSFERWAAPIQNFICADKKDVAIVHAGLVPKRLPGEGRFILNSQSARAEYLTDEQRPKKVRPANGVVASANQRVTDQYFPYDLGWNYEEPFRGRRINEKLRLKDRFTPMDFIEMQNDIFDDHARLALSFMLNHLSGHEDFKRELSQWDYRVFANDWRPALFKEWFREAKTTYFSSQYSPPGRKFWPRDVRFIEILKALGDDSKVNNLLQKSFERAVANLSRDQGADYRAWRFDQWQKLNMPHVARLPGFGVPGLVVDGSAYSIRGNQGHHGAVYKIVVAHGEWPEVFIQVPGGNEGDPLSPHYGRFVKDWADGQMRKAEYYRDLNQAKSKAVKVVEFTP